jgi:hypothetical protein
MTIICTVNVSLGFFFLEETYVPVLLSARKNELEKTDPGSYYFNGEDDRPNPKDSASYRIQTALVECVAYAVSKTVQTHNL